MKINHRIKIFVLAASYSDFLLWQGRETQGFNEIELEYIKGKDTLLRHVSPYQLRVIETPQGYKHPEYLDIKQEIERSLRVRS